MRRVARHSDWLSQFLEIRRRANGWSPLSSAIARPAHCAPRWREPQPLLVLGYYVATTSDPRQG